MNFICVCVLRHVSFPLESENKKFKNLISGFRVWISALNSVCESALETSLVLVRMLVKMLNTLYFERVHTVYYTGSVLQRERERGSNTEYSAL